MNFAYPWVFFGLIPILLLLIRQAVSRRRQAMPFSSVATAESTPPSIRQIGSWLPDVVRTLAVVALLVAVARPQTDHFISSLQREGVAIELLVDISSSMEMRMKHEGRDVNRMEVAKAVIKQFVTGDEKVQLKGRPDDLVGLISFARFTDTLCPLTLSHDAVIFMADELKINVKPNEDGTAYGDATMIAAARLAKLEETLTAGSAEAAALGRIKSKIIVLLTDGENNCGEYLPLQAAALAKEWGIRIYTISLTEAPKTQFVLVEGETQETIEAARARGAAERNLEKMAEMTGGIFRTAFDFDTLQAVYKEIDQLERSQLRSTHKRIPGEQFHWFALAGLSLLMGELALRSTWLRQVP